MRKVVSVLFAAVGASVVLLAQHAIAQEPVTYEVSWVESGKVLDVHQSPNPHSQVIGSLENGANVTSYQCTFVLEIDWCRIDYKGKVGWVDLAYLK